MDIIKNEIYQVTIEDIGADGEGIGRVDGYTLFIKDAVMGDVVEAKVLKMKKNYGYARLEKILNPSEYRVKPRCPVARTCGGCSIQHLAYDKQLEYKQQKVKNSLERIGKFEHIADKMEAIVGMDDPYFYRNKAQFPVGLDKAGAVVTGFYAGRTHSIIDNTKCYIQAKVNEVVLNKVKEHLKENHIEPYNEGDHTGLLRHILTRVGFVTGEIMVCLVINGNKLPNQKQLIDSLCQVEGMTSISLNINKDKTNRILGDKVITMWGKSSITDYIGDVKYQISPLSFYQVNPVQTKILYEKALEYADLTGEEVVWDLYCGIGTISLFLAQKAKKVYGVDVVEDAIKDAKNNAFINGINNVEFLVGKAEEILPKHYADDKIYADVIVVDPPRKGCEEELLKTIVTMKPKKMVYVSCDPGSLARDLKFLCENGYEIDRVGCVDQFCHTVHVEVVTLLQRIEG